jgi:hypothetical protein
MCTPFVKKNSDQKVGKNNFVWLLVTQPSRKNQRECMSLYDSEMDFKGKSLED